MKSGKGKRNEGRPYVRFRLANADQRQDGTIPLGEEDIEKLGGVRISLRAFKKVLCKGFATETVLLGPEILVHLDAVDDIQKLDTSFNVVERTNELIDALNRVAGEVHTNAQSRDPKPVEKAVSVPKVIPLLKALACAFQQSHLEVSVAIGGKLRPLPTPALEDFTGAEQAPETTLRDVFELNGIRRGEQDGKHRLITTGNIEFVGENAVIFAMDKIREVLEHAVWYDGTLAREQRDKPWVAKEGKLVTQLEMLERPATNKQKRPARRRKA